MYQTNCMVAQSGGPTAAINASLAGVISGVKESSAYQTCYGAVNGILGIQTENYLNLTERIADGETLKRLIATPAMYLGSCRHRLPDFREDEGPYTHIFRQFEKLGVGAFFYIGGNDSMDTVQKLSDYARKTDSSVRIIGIPKTIDNDLCMTDHTPGFGSAAKYIACTMLEIAHDTFIYPVKSVTIVEIMGRDAGWLAASAALARCGYSDAPHLIYLPEAPFSAEQFLSDVKAKLAVCSNVVVAVSEGIRDLSGRYITASQASDQFGHLQLSGAGKALEFLVKENLGVKVRSVEINVLQRCASHLASACDLSESFALGRRAVALSASGVTASMVTISRTGDDPYTVSYGHAPVKEIANLAKSVPRSWISEAGNDICPQMYAYLRPLIQGEHPVTYKNGIPDYLPVTHLKPQL